MIFVDITYEVWSEADREAGETYNRGYVDRDRPMDFRELLEQLRHADLSERPPAGRTWATVDMGETRDFFERGEREYRSYHFSPTNPEHRLRWWVKALELATRKPA